MSVIKPTNITLNKLTRQILIDWNDGSSCAYPLTPLRLACPCVDCRGGHEKMGRAYDPEDLLSLTSERDFEIEQMDLVGNYALQIYWDDGHHTGIYTWDYLHHLCPKKEQGN